MTESNRQAPWWVQVGIAVLIALGGGLIGRAITYMNKTDQATINVASLINQFADFRQSVHDDLVSIKDQIKTFPDQRAAVDALIHHGAEVDNHLSALDARVSADERTLYQAQLDINAVSKTVDAIKQASGPIRVPR